MIDPSIPFQATANPPSLLRSIEGAQQVRQSNLANHQGQQTLQTQVMQNQMGAQQMKDQQAATKAMQEWDGKDLNQLPSLILKNGGSAQAVIGAKQQLLSYQTSLTKLSTDQLANETTKNNSLAQLVANVKGLPPEQQPQAFEQAKAQAVQSGWLDPQHAQAMQYQGPQALDLLEKSLIGHTAATANQLAVQKQAETERHDQADEVNQGLRIQSEQLSAKDDMRYRMIQQQKALGNPVSQGDAAWATGYEKQKTLGTRTTFALQNALPQGQNGQPSSIAQALASNQMKWQDVVSMRTPMAIKQKLLDEVRSINPNYNSGDFSIEQGVRKSATSGKIADNLTAFNTAIDHAKQLQSAANALDNGDLPGLNKIGNALGYQFGSDKTTNFNVIKNALAGEVSKVFKGGQATDAEIRAVEEPFSAANSPAQLKGAIQNAVSLMNSKRNALKEQVEKGMTGQANFGDSAAPSATGPNGHKITVKDGKWVDAQTGAPI